MSRLLTARIQVTFSVAQPFTRSFRNSSRSTADTDQIESKVKIKIRLTGRDTGTKYTPTTAQDLNKVAVDLHPSIPLTPIQSRQVLLSDHRIPFHPSWKPTYPPPFTHFRQLMLILRRTLRRDPKHTEISLTAVSAGFRFLIESPTVSFATATAQMKPPRLLSSRGLQSRNFY